MATSTSPEEPHHRKKKVSQSPQLPTHKKDMLTRLRAAPPQIKHQMEILSQNQQINNKSYPISKNQQMEKIRVLINWTASIKRSSSQQSLYRLHLNVAKKKTPSSEKGLSSKPKSSKFQQPMVCSRRDTLRKPTRNMISKPFLKKHKIWRKFSTAKCSRTSLANAKASMLSDSTAKTSITSIWQPMS